MFSCLLGWRKASKCKSVVKQLQCRLKLLKNKKCAISSHLRHDIGQLLRIGERNRALHRTQYLFLDENLMSLYNSLLQFSDFILLHLSYIRRHKDLPDDINEAVSTLVFASARCGDLPELRTLRLIFMERYGQPFVSTALHLLPGNRVNPQIKEKLSIISVSDDAKTTLLAEIAAEHNLRLPVLALEYTPEFIEQVRDSEEAEEEKEAEMFTLTEKQEESCSKASRDQRKICNEYYCIKEEVLEKDCIEEKVLEEDCIEEEVLEKDQRVFRFRETEEERKERKRSRCSSSPIAKDVECWRYYYKGRRRRQKKECGQCYHIVYNVFTMRPGDQKEKGQGERALKEAKHVHPKLPDYDQIAVYFTTLKEATTDTLTLIPRSHSFTRTQK